MPDKPLPIDYESLEKLCQIQCTGEECAHILGIDYETLNTALHREGHGGFVEFLKKHGAGGKASLRRMQWKGAEAGNATMLIWLGKQYLGQSDKADFAHTSPDGSMTPQVTALDPAEAARQYQDFINGQE